MAKEPTERHRDILSYIKRTPDVVGVASGIQEIQQEFSFKSANAVQTHLLARTKKGFVHRPHRQARTLRLVKGADHPNGNGTGPVVALAHWAAPTVPGFPAAPATGGQGHRSANGGATTAAPPPVAAPVLLRSPVPPENGAGGCRDGNGRAATKTGFDDSFATIPVPPEAQPKTGVDVFFKTRRVVAKKLDGEVHARS